MGWRLCRPAGPFLEPIGAATKIPLAFGSFFAGAFESAIFFARVLLLARPRLVIGFVFLRRIGSHDEKLARARAEL
jgi:hypothetical protein